MNMSIDTSEFDKFPSTGRILKLENHILKEHLGENLEAWKESVTKFPKNVKTRTEKEEYLKARADEEVLVVYFDVQGVEYDNFFTIPRTQGGYQQSNLRKVRVLNELPPNTKDWVGKEVKINQNDKGFPELSK